jgi:hypothetical protein
MVWSANASIDSTTRQFFSKSEVEISAVFLGGTMNPPGASICLGLEDVIKTIKGIKDSTIRVTSGPMSIQVESYLSTLQRYPKCLDALTPIQLGSPAEAPWGVPAGTVLPWIPRPGDFARDIQTGEITRVVPPIGWAICDGNGTPDLRDSCTWGAPSYTDPGDQGRQLGTNAIPMAGNHNHGGRTATLAYSRGEINWDRKQGHQDDFSHLHAISADGDHSHGGDKRPQRVHVVYIMKL